jgi:hypothetical protein
VLQMSDAHTINTRLDFRKIACEGINWMHLAQVRVQWWAFVNLVMNILVP